MAHAGPTWAEFDTSCQQIEEAFAHNNIQWLQQAEFSRQDAIALQQFRLVAAYIPAKQTPMAIQAIQHGLQAVAEGLEQEPDNVRLLLLGAMLDGQWLLLRPWRFLHNGRRALRRLRNAEKLAPDNPRVALLRGTAKVILPGILGGNAKDAIEMFEQALGNHVAANVSFEQSQLCHAGEWGQVDLLNWLGRAYTKTGDQQAAENAYQRALLRSPNNHWVKLALQGNGYEWVDPDK